MEQMVIYFVNGTEIIKFKAKDYDNSIMSRKHFKKHFFRYYEKDWIMFMILMFIMMLLQLMIYWTFTSI